MSLSDMKSRETVLQAVKEFDQVGRTAFLKKYGFGKAKEFFLDYNGKLYDSKAIIGAAHGYEFPAEGSLTPRDFSGGNATVKPKLEELGFSVRAQGVELPIPATEVEEAVEASLSLEKDLEAFLANNLTQLEPGLRLCKENGLSGRQVDAKAAGRIDILAVDSHGDLVVIEVKVGEVDREVCGQIQGYMSWIMDTLAGQRRVRGFLVASDFTERLKLAAKIVPGLSLRQYRVNFEFIAP